MVCFSSVKVSTEVLTGLVLMLEVLADIHGGMSVASRCRHQQLFQRLCGYAVQFRQIPVQPHFLTADIKDLVGQKLFRRKSLSFHESQSDSYRIRGQPHCSCREL